MRTFDQGRIMLTAALLATVAALGAAASPAGAHDGHEHVVLSDGAVVGSPPMSRGRLPQAARPAARPRARRRAPRARAASYQAGIPDHQSRFTCSVVNGVANFEGFAHSAGLMHWIEPASYGISTLSNQYVYFRLWSGRPNGTGGHHWTTGNWARSRVGTAYNWEAFIGGRWVDQSTGTYGILPFAVASYMIGSLSYVREPVNTTRRFYFEWQWNRFDANWRFTGQWVQHWDYVGDRYCAA
jgi:hypothetical protein